MGHPAIPCVRDVYMKINVFQRFCQKPDACAHLMMRKAQQQSMAATFFEFVLRSATADVLTLYQNKAETGGGVAARLESLLRAFDEKNIHIIGAQETRSEMRGHSTCQGFHILSAAASAPGAGGIQFWIRTTWRSPQHMIVRLCRDELCLLLIVAHAPACPLQQPPLFGPSCQMTFRLPIVLGH